jgi:predicted transcriptional regulator
VHTLNVSTTLRVSEETRQRVADLAAATGRQMQAVVEDAVLAYERSIFWDSFDQGYQRLAEDNAQWAEVQNERAAEASALQDGVE